MSNKIYGIPAATPLNPEKVYDDAVIAGAVEKYLEENPPACDIPTALPNPHALTINGFAYDGSEAVEVNIKAEGGGIVTETDPTVPAWAKEPAKPSYTASEVGAVPVTTTVNGKALSSDISLSASDVGAAPSSHMDDKENPHGVTAAQVGARPDTWMPTATEVGARPSTWVPTAEEIGAAPASHLTNKDNPHGVTAEQVGAIGKEALDGKVDNKNGEAYFLNVRGILNLTKEDQVDGAYFSASAPRPNGTVLLEMLGTMEDEPVILRGLGYPEDGNDAVTLDYANENYAPISDLANKVDHENGEAKYLTVKGVLNLMRDGDSDGVYLAGFHHQEGKVQLEIRGTADDDAVILSGLADPESGMDAVPLAYADSHYVPISNRMVNGVQVWSNPPMLPGVEYRTMEQWNGKPVYRKLVQWTNPATLSGDNMYQVVHGISNLDRSMGVEITTRTQGYQIPYVTIQESTAVTGCSATHIELRTTGTTSWAANRTWYFDMKYTKTV